MKTGDTGVEPTELDLTGPDPRIGATDEEQKLAADPTGRGWSPLVIVLLGVSGMLDFVDRFVFSTANDAIKHELHLSDATIGLLGGTAFALLYCVAIVPLALISDRGYAARMAGAGIALWSVATAAAGRASGVATLALARVGVGLGQAGYSPSSSAINAAYSSPERRATAFSLSYGISYLGYVVGLAGGGWGVEHLGWRMTFEVVGLAGVPVAVLIWVFVREPHARHLAPEQESWRALLRNRDLRDLTLWGVTSSVLSYGSTLWGVSFYMRSFGLTAGQAGAWFGLGIGVAIMLGTLPGGWLADRLARRTGLGFATVMQFSFWTSLIAQPFGVVQVLTHSLSLSLAMLVLNNLVGSLSAGPLYGAVPTVVPAHQRATATAMFAFFANGIGIGLGPPLFGLISDLLAPHFGEQSLRMSLLVAAVLSFVPVIPLWRLQRRLRAKAA